MSGAAIYGLYDNKGNLRYVGKSNNPQQRLKDHVRRANYVKRKSALDRWLIEEGTPFMGILEADCSDWQEAERRHIREARAQGAALFNISPGGNGAILPKAETPEAIKRANAFIKRYTIVMHSLGAPRGPWAALIREQIATARKNGSLSKLAERYERVLPKELPQ